MQPAPTSFGSDLQASARHSASCGRISCPADRASRPPGPWQQRGVAVKGNARPPVAQRLGPSPPTTVSLPATRLRLRSSPQRFLSWRQPDAWHDLCSALRSVLATDVSRSRRTEVTVNRPKRTRFAGRPSPEVYRLRSWRTGSEGSRSSSKLMHREDGMHSIFWLIGVIVVVVAVLNLIG